MDVHPSGVQSREDVLMKVVQQIRHTKDVQSLISTTVRVSLLDEMNILVQVQFSVERILLLLVS